MFKQSKKHIADFMIEFKALAMKAETDNLHAIFLLKKETDNKKDDKQEGFGEGFKQV